MTACGVFFLYFTEFYVVFCGIIMGLASGVGYE